MGQYHIAVTNPNIKFEIAVDSKIPSFPIENKAILFCRYNPILLFEIFVIHNLKSCY